MARLVPAFPTLSDIRAAHERIRGRIHRTPVVTSQTLDARVGAEVFLKCEHLQKTGSFKIRGATNAVAQLSAEERRRGVVTHSSGNHAQAVAQAGAWFGAPVTVVMPEGAPRTKREATEGYGARIVTCAPNVEARSQAARRIVAETGAVLVHPYDDPRIVAGQATAAVELLEDVPRLDVLMAPIGGGGLLSGTTLAAAYLSPRTRVIGAEPAGADDAHRGLAAGRRVTEVDPRTIADGLRTTVGELTFAILREHRVDVVTVSEAEIVEALRFAWERMKLLIEPSSAVPLGALLSGRVDARGKRVGVILTGGNADLSAALPRLSS